MDSFKIARLKKYKKIVIYGAGDYAKGILIALRNHEITVDYCVVTNKKENPDFLEGIPVYEINDYYTDLQRKDTVVLVGTSKVYENEIVENICSFNIKNFLTNEQLYRNQYVTLNNYKIKSLQKCMQEIAEWYLDCFVGNSEDYNQVMTRLEALIDQRGRNKKKIIFAVGDLSPRVIKIARALSEKGYEIKVYICPGALVREVCSNELHELKIFCHICKYMEELMYYLMCEQPWIIHIFSCRDNSIAAYALVKMKNLFSTIVYDEYDIINEMYAYMPREWLEAERYCLENADGICNRGYELEYLIKKANYNIKGKSIQFLDYCKDKTVNLVYRNEKETLSLCYAGSIQTEKEQPDSSVACWLELANLCEKNQCHLHIYPLTWDTERFAEYIELDEKNEYFHFYKPIPYTQIDKVLSKYDYMVHPARADFMSREINGFYHRRKGIYGCSNKYFDSLDAGLPIIGVSMIKFTQFFEEKGVCIRWAIEEYDFNLLKEKRNQLRKNVISAQEELQIKKHIYKLIEFYESL